MIELSLGKMVLLALIALIVLGPEKLPGAARTAGALLRRVRSGWDNVRAEVARELEIEEIRRSAREAVAGAEAAQQQVKDTLKETHNPFAEAAAMVRLQPSASSGTASKPEDLTPEEPGASRHLPGPPSGSVSTEIHSAQSPSSEEGPHEAAPEDQPLGDQALEGMQAELPLDEPPIEPVRDRHPYERTSYDRNSYDEDRPHGNA